MDWLLFGIVCYVAAQLLVAAIVSRRIASEADYLLAGRSLSFPLAVFSIFATWFGSETCIGTAGIAYSEGLSGVRADPFGYALCLAVMGLFLAWRLWTNQLTTLADLFRQRFGIGAERVAVALMVPTSLLWAAAQIRAFGQVLSATSSISLELTIAFAALVVIVYTMWGGLMADVVTDVFQGSILILGLIILFVLVWFSYGSPSTLIELVNPQRLQISRNEGGGILEFFERWSVPIFGSLVAQELISRVLAARNATVARNSALTASALYFLIGSIPLYLGLVATVIVPNVGEGDQVLVQLAREVLSPVLYVVFVGALVSAILSTVDSALLAASSLLAHNMLAPILHSRSESARLRVHRLAVLGFGVVAYLIARSAERVYELVEQASSFGSAGLVIVMLFGLCTKVGGSIASIASLLSSFIVWIWASKFATHEFPYVLSLTAGLFAFSVGAALDSVRAKAAAVLQ